jgi:riboflavin biosynthesis pyrimidine reductase
MIARPLDELSDDDLLTLYPRRTGVRASFVASADGAVSVDGLSAGLSSGADKRVFRLLRMVCDAVLVGAGTLRAEAYRPITLDETRRAWRVAHGLPPAPHLVVVSASLDLDPAQPALAQAPVRPIIVTSARVDTAAHPLSAVADLLPSGTPTSPLDLPHALATLAAEGLAGLLCEGGPRLFGALTGAGLVDEVCLTVAPLLAGAGAGRITAGEPGPARRMRLAHALTSDDALLLRYLKA